MKKIFFLLMFLPTQAWCQAFSAMPYVFVTGQSYNPSQLQTDFQAIVSQGNSVGAFINSQISAVTPPPSGTILFFHLAACPTGWTNLGAANVGRFVRGYDSGRGIDPSPGAVGATEAASLQDHTHGFTSMTGINTVGLGADVNNPIFVETTIGSTGSNHGTGNNGTANDIPDNVALFLCQKN